MNDRLLIASMAMEGILVGMFGDRPTSRPPPEKIAQLAVVYADALMKAEMESRILPPEEIGPTSG